MVPRLPGPLASTVLALLLAGCGGDAVDPCAAMCEAAETLYGGCLEDWGADWAAAGYADGADFVDACETWAWQMRLLEEHEGSAVGWTDQTCQERTVLFEAGECAAFTGIDWNQMPWDPGGEVPAE